LVVCGATTGCYLGTQAREEAPATTSTLGDENMSVAHTPSRVQHANETSFDSLVLKSDVPVLVDFYADWCGPCQRLAPILEELAGEIQEARIVKVNVDDSPKLAAQYGVESIPSLKFFKRGVVTEQLVGLADKNQLKSMISR
jgi:thioredoxin 1